jgi:hypothetical protein
VAKPTIDYARKAPQRPWCLHCIAILPLHRLQKRPAATERHLLLQNGK